MLFKLGINRDKPRNRKNVLNREKSGSEAKYYDFSGINMPLIVMKI